MKSFLLGTDCTTVVSFLLPFGAVWQRKTFAANPELLVFIFGNHVNLVECPHSFMHWKFVFPYSLLSNLLFLSFYFIVRGTEFVGIRKMVLIPLKTDYLCGASQELLSELQDSSAETLGYKSYVRVIAGIFHHHWSSEFICRIVGPGTELLFCFHNVTFAVPEKQNWKM